MRQVLGPDHQDTLTAQSKLARLSNTTPPQNHTRLEPT